MSESETVEIIKLNEIDSVLQSPDVYFGDIKIAKYNDYIYDYKTNTIEKQKNIISQILLKMTDEILMNCSDNFIRSMKSINNKMTYIKVRINEKKRLISIENDGLSIPIKKNKEYNVYVPQLVFSSLFSSSNFNDKRTGAGKNGVGASITNIMSTYFAIDIVNDGKQYFQSFENNCHDISEPEITKTDEPNHVKISFIPDMKRIIKLGIPKDSDLKEQLKNENKDIEQTIFNNTLPYIYRRVLDVAVSLYNNDTKKNAKVYLNKVELNGVSLIEYAALILNKEPTESNFIEFTKDKIYDIVLYTNPSDKMQKTIISFVNNINVNDGIHINNLLKQISEYATKKLKTNKDDKQRVKKIIESSLSMFIKCNLLNPLFEGQGKTKLQVADNINSVKFTQKDLERIFNEIDFDTLINGQHMKDINKVTKVKRNERLIIDKLCDAELAGSRQSKNCTLFLCEGDSAAKLAKDGIAQLGHDKFGVYPLGGKPMNIIRASIDKITNNKTVINLAKILGLPIRTRKQIEKGEELDLSKLRYGKIVMLKDADTDGAHIMALTINLLQQIYPELLNIEGFFNEFITPMIKLIIPLNVFNKLGIEDSNKNAGTIIKTKKNIIYPFYNTDAYYNFIDKFKECGRYQPIYVKGLGGHNDSDTREYFKNYLLNVVHVLMDSNANKNLNIAFDDKFISKRKEIIQGRTGEHSLPRFINTPITCSDFINNDWIDYSYDACVRAIPSAIDGLKPSQRKVLYVMLNNYKPAKSNTEENADRFKKVFQICGEVAQKGYYHHGDQSLNGTIIKMAQDFAGSNNLPLLAYSGSFGSRDANGDDAGAPRYISATIHEIARYIYPSCDDCLLTLNIEDNNEVEPIYYVPIIPMILVNGSIGIGTGYSSTILQYNPLDIINNVRKFIEAKKEGKIKKLTFKPHYNYFKGDIEKEGKNKYSVNGCFEIDNNKVHITEIPFNISKQKFISRLQELYLSKVITNWKEYKTKTLNDFDFDILFAEENEDNEEEPQTNKKKETKDKQEKGNKNIISSLKKVNKYDEETKEISAEFIEKSLLMKQFISINNMNAFNADCSLTEYATVQDLFKEWFDAREKLYEKRKDKVENDYENEINYIGEKARFIKLVIEGELIINNRPKDCIINDLEYKFAFRKFNNDEQYGYLLNMPISTLTREKYEELCKKLEQLTKEYEEYKQLTINDIWLSELNKLEEYIKNNYDVDNW